MKTHVVVMGKVFEMGTDPHFSSKAKESRFVAGRRSCISQVSLRVTTSVPGHSPPDCISQPQPLSPPLTSSHSLADIFLDCQNIYPANCRVLLLPAYPFPCIGSQKHTLAASAEKGNSLSCATTTPLALANHFHSQLCICLSKAALEQL